MPAITGTVLAVAGIASGGAGAFASISGSRRQAEAQQQEIEAQQKQEALRRKAMELDARRRSVEVLRNQQRARSLALATSTAQGASLGSGLQGGYGQIAGQSNTNLLGISQGLQTGEANFDLNSQISAARMNMASAGAQVALGAGLSSFGSSLMNASSTFNRIGMGFGNNNQGTNTIGLPTYGSFLSGIKSNGIY